MKGKFFILFFLMLSCVVFGQAVNGVLFINSTGYEITELYVSPTSHDDWYDDLLNGQTVGDGDSLTFSIPDYDNSDLLFDAMAVDSDGDEYSRFEIDLSNPNEKSLELTFDDYDDDEYYEGDYDTGYNDGYRDAFRDSYSEAFKEGYKAGFDSALEINQ
ncbi:MAG: hypothetical protein PF693_18415 [Spirochaetia bacterium]|jgi:hypothetical protein|nr:hypothetical protein [Spirochaetia bacterium]